jgi:predicted ArsR family transcriptional regulator
VVDPDGFAAQVAGVAALAEPVRRDLYLYVVAQAEPVGREAASRAVGIPLHTAKFHLDRLVEEGLLETEYRRLSGRAGPGAGRPAKLYRRSAREVSVALPARRYDLAGALMARAIEDSTREGSPVLTALSRAAAELGAGTAAAVRAESGPAAPDDVLTTTKRTLALHGYEPHTDGTTTMLANCPFDALAKEHTELVCGMNLALVGALVDDLTEGQVDCRLDPAPGRCCVVLSALEADTTEV